MMTQHEIKEQVDLMNCIGVSVAHKDYFIQSANDEKNDDIISLIHDLSSKAWWFCLARGSEEMRARGEAHLEARKKLIEKIKGLRSHE